MVAALPKGPGKAKPLHTQEGWLSQTRGKRITVRLLDGKALSGTLSAFDQYALTLMTGTGTDTVLVYKHAVAYIIIPAASGS